MTPTRIALLSLALVLAGLGIRLHVAASKADEWNAADGIVIESYVRRAGAGNAAEAGDTDTYTPVVKYQYNVGATRYTGSRISFGDLFHNWYSSKKQTRAFPKGSAVTVYFDPEQPDNAVLDRTYPSVPIAMLGFLVVLLGLAGAYLPQLVRSFMSAMLGRYAR